MVQKYDELQSESSDSPLVPEGKSWSTIAIIICKLLYLNHHSVQSVKLVLGWRNDAMQGFVTPLYRRHAGAMCSPSFFKMGQMGILNMIKCVAPFHNLICEPVNMLQLQNQSKCQLCLRRSALDRTSHHCPECFCGYTIINLHSLMVPSALKNIIIYTYRSRQIKTKDKWLFCFLYFQKNKSKNKII